MVADQPINNPAPATYVYADSLLREAVGVADERNERMGHHATCAADIYVYDPAPNSLDVARGEQPGCRIWFARAYRDEQWRVYTDRREALVDRREALVNVCTVAIHERLHNLGFGHTATGIMTPFVTTRPGACVRWSRLKLPR